MIGNATRFFASKPTASPNGFEMNFVIGDVGYEQGLPRLRDVSDDSLADRYAKSRNHVRAAARDRAEEKSLSRMIELEDGSGLGFDHA